MCSHPKMASENGEVLDMGHKGAGDNCLDKTAVYAMNGAVAGAVYGSFAACFLTPVKGSTTPMIARALGTVAANSILLASVGGIFASSCCFAAGLRDKDDSWNAAAGGAAAGSLFGVRARSLPMGLGMAAGLALACAVIKFRFGTYVPQLPNTTRVKRILPTPTLSSVDDNTKSH